MIDMQGKALEKDPNNTNLLDKLGIVLSTICFIHCLALPFFTIGTPFIANYLDEKIFHFLMFIVLVPLTLFTYFHGYKIHRSLKILLLGASGLTFLFIGLLNSEEQGGAVHAHSTESVLLTILGGVLLITGHYFNIKKCRCHKHHH